MADTLLPGITAHRVTTPRYTAHVLERPADAAIETPRAVLFVHGNVSSSLFWQPLMLDLPSHVRGLAPDLRGYGDSDVLPVYEFTDEFAQLQPPPPDLRQLIGAMAGQQRAMDDFVSVQAATLPAPAFFDPGNVARIMAAGSTT